MLVISLKPRLVRLAVPLCRSEDVRSLLPARTVAARSHRRVSVSGSCAPSGTPVGSSSSGRICSHASRGLSSARRADAASRGRPVVTAAGRDITGFKKRDDFNGVFILLLVNVALFVADHVLHLPGMLYLNHQNPQWWQCITCAFCHASWAHLSSNIFFLYIFGKAVEEEEGAVGVWFTYLITGLGASLASLLLLPKTTGGLLGGGVVSLGASGAVFGLFVVSVLVRLKWSFRKLLESFILGQFVLERLMSEVSMASVRGGIGAGVMFIVLLSKILPPDGAGKGSGDGDIVGF